MKQNKNYQKENIGKFYPMDTEMFKVLVKKTSLLKQLKKLNYEFIVVFKGNGDKGKVYEINKLLGDLKK